MLRSSGLEEAGDRGDTESVEYPAKTVATVQSELARRKLRCPFPSAVHSRLDFFEALLERLQIDGL